MKLNPAAFAAWLLSLLSSVNGYLMGAVGQKAKDLSLGSWLIAQYKAVASQYTKAKYWLAHAVQVFDCQGLADCYLTDNLGKKINVYARNNYDKWCTIKGVGTIPSKYRVPGAAVYKHNGTRISHVGFLVAPVDPVKPDGDWYVVEAKGVMYGVIRTKLLSGTWNRWGLMDVYFNYDAVLAQYHNTELIVYVLGSRLLKKGMTGTDVTDLQEALIKLGYGALTAPTGTYDDLTVKAVKAFQKASYDLKVDGLYGELTHGALMDALDDESPEGDQPEVAKKTVKIIAPGTWNIRKGAGTGNGILTVVKQGTEMPYVSTAVNGWFQVEILGTTGWVSNKCAEVA